MESNVTGMHFLEGGGELGSRIREFDWRRTPLGPPECWPAALRTALRIMLGSRQPFWIGWGPDLIYFYNDSYKSIIGGKHPDALGLPASRVWSEIWDVIGPMLTEAMKGDMGTYVESQFLVMERHGYQEETYYTYSYTPIPDEHGRPGGIICANTDDTARVIGERQLALLSRIASGAAEARTFGEACVRSLEAVAIDARDVPFAMIYLEDAESKVVRLTSTSGIEVGHPAAPVVLPASDQSVWPLCGALQGRTLTVVPDLASRFDRLPSGPWQKTPTHAVVVPLPLLGPSGRAGALIVGLNPFRQFDGEYRRFITLAAAQIAAAAAHADAYEQERQRAEALLELDRAKTTFFSNVSHEFRTPLTLLLGPLEDGLADSEIPLPPAQRERLEVAHRNAMRLLRLVNTLLDFSRIEAGRVDAVYEAVDLAALTADVASVFRSAVEKAGLAFVIDCPALPDRVYVDREMWEKIVLNLVSNAFKFTFSGEIVVSLRVESNRVDLFVRDSGVGIAEHQLSHIFERFHRIRETRGRTHEGTGIGLALVQELVRLHGGTVKVASSLGRGTTFTVSIPTGISHLPADRIEARRALSSTALTASPFIEESLRWLPDEIRSNGRESTQPLATGSVRILLADDNADMRDYLRRILSTQWIVQAVGDGQAGLEAARAETPNLVLADVMMPRLDGFGLLRALRDDPLTRNIPVILLSARAGEESRVEGFAAGADDYLVKPFSARELVARVNAHLELARVRQAALDREQAARTVAEQANRAKDEFLAVLSHELRTPLNAILGWSSMLITRASDHETLQHGLEVVNRNARVQAQLIEDLLDVSRIISGKLRLDVRAVDLMTLVHAALDVVRPAAEAKAIRLQPILDPKAGPVAGDPGRLQQVVWNLLSNAIKFTPKGGHIQLRVERVNSHVEIVVADSGIGITADFLPYIFDRFRQADSSPTRRHGGLGLGLALVKHLVELHGATVRAESPGVDQGTTFIVELPIMAQMTTEVTSRDHPTAHRVTVAPDTSLVAGLRLLIVDDETETLKLFRQLFTEWGAHVVVANSVAGALDELERTHPDVLISDVEMPGEDGYSLIRRVRSLPLGEGGAVPAVAVTAYGSVDDRIRLLAAGFQMHVPKPVDPVELVTVIASVAGRTGK